MWGLNWKIKSQNTILITWGQACMTSIWQSMCSLTIIGFRVPKGRRMWRYRSSGGRSQSIYKSKAFKAVSIYRWKTTLNGNAVAEMFQFLPLTQSTSFFIQDIWRSPAICVLWLLWRHVEICNWQRHLRQPARPRKLVKQNVPVLCWRPLRNSPVGPGQILREHWGKWNLLGYLR